MPCRLDRFHPALVVVDVVDDHRAWPGVSEEEEQNLTRNYRDLLSLADIAMANREPVQKAMHGFCPDIRLVPNGCDSDPPRATPDSGTQFDAFQSFAGHTNGYAGNQIGRAHVCTPVPNEKIVCRPLIATHIRQNYATCTN